MGATMFVGVILAYIERGKLTEPMLESHVEKQIRMFWIWFIVLALFYVLFFIAFIPSFVSMGAMVYDGPPTFAFASFGIMILLSFLVTIGLFLYILISSILSLRRLDNGEPILSY